MAVSSAKIAKSASGSKNIVNIYVKQADTTQKALRYIAGDRFRIKVLIFNFIDDGSSLDIVIIDFN